MGHRRIARGAQLAPRLGSPGNGLDVALDRRVLWDVWMGGDVCGKGGRGERGHHGHAQERLFQQIPLR